MAQGEKQVERVKEAPPASIPIQTKLLTANLDSAPLGKVSQPTITPEHARLSWKLAKSLYHQPALHDPKIASPPPPAIGGCFDFGTNETHIDPKFVSKLSAAAGVDAETVFTAISAHEIGHYIDFPRNLARIILLNKIVRDFCNGNEITDANFQNHVMQTFSDMANDTAGVLRPGTRDYVLAVREALQIVYDDKLRSLMLSYLRLQAGQNPKLDPEIANIRMTNDPKNTKTFLDHMLSIDFTSASSSTDALRLGVFTWMEIVRKMDEKFPPPQKRGESKEEEAGEKGTTGEELIPKDMGEWNIKDASREEIDQALRELSRTTNRGEFKRIRSMVRDIRGEEDESKREPKCISIGTSSGELKVDTEVVVYYRELAKNYPITVVRKPLETADVRKSLGSTEKFRMGSDPNLLLPHSSGGQIIPGITRSIKIIERPRTTLEYNTPHALIIIDSSGSQQNPAQQKSSMVLAAVCAALSYHKQGSKIGVINFSGDSFYLSYTRDIIAVLAAIVAYQGGGTVVDVELVKKMLGEETLALPSSTRKRELDLKALDQERNLELILSRPEYAHIVAKATKKNVKISEDAVEKMLNEKSIDMMLFSDLGIMNLGEVIKLCEERASINRVTVISNADAASAGLKSDGKIRIYDNIADIDATVKITIGGIQDALNSGKAKPGAHYGASLS